MSTTLEALMTPEELLAMPNGGHCELVDGETKEKDMGAALSAWVGTEVAGQLRDYCKKYGGYAFGDGASYRCYDDDPNRVRIPDASYIRPGRLEGGEIPLGYLTVPPDLAVEVVSPSDHYTDVEDKAEEYLAAGVAVVWVINPTNRSVRIFRQDARPEQIGPNDELTAEAIMPGFRCRVADLFPNSTPPSPTRT